jgi:hypothetical protein
MIAKPLILSCLIAVVHFTCTTGAVNDGNCGGINMSLTSTKHDLVAFQSVLSSAAMTKPISATLTSPSATTTSSSTTSERHNHLQHVCVAAVKGTATGNTRIGTTVFRHRSRPQTKLSMGFLDFFQSRESDFIKLHETQDAFGPGPVVLLYNVPNEIQDEEISWMIQDGAPLACKKCKGKMVPFRRVYPEQFVTVEEEEEFKSQEGWKDNSVRAYHDLTVEQLLENVLTEWNENKEWEYIIQSQFATNQVVTRNHNEAYEKYAPIIYFSGFAHDEMMNTYNIISNEIFQETQGRAKAACAKVVEPAMQKNVCQLLSEISNDHAQAMEN